MLHRRKCLLLSMLVMLLQLFYIVGGPVTAEGEEDLAKSLGDEAGKVAAEDSDRELTRVEKMKISFQNYEAQLSEYTLVQGRQRLIEMMENRTGMGADMEFSKYIAKQQEDVGQVSAGSVSNASRNGDHVMYTLLVAVPSAPGGFDKRHLIRETWYKPYQGTSLVLLRFIVGTHNVSRDVMHNLREEAKYYNDIVMIDDLLDSYHNLTRKTLYTFIWSAYNVRFFYLFKCDDDTYPMLAQVLHELQHRETYTRLYWGYFLTNAPVRRTGKWKDRKWSLGKYYVKFAIGGAYIISSDIVDLVVKNAPFLQIFTNEDVAVGLWLASFDIERKHDKRLCRFFTADKCPNDSIMALGVSDDDYVFLNMKSQ